MTGCCCILFLLAKAGDGEYAASKIAPSLLRNADAVCRLEETRYTVVSNKTFRQYDHYVITILNENGDRWADFTEWYDKLRSIESIEGVLYDASGKEIKKVKKKDVDDVSGVSDASLFDDNRVKHHNFYYRVYPYTVEYEVETETKGLFSLPRWMPQNRDRYSVEKSTISVQTPADYEVRYKAFNYAKEPVLSTEKGDKILTWTVDNMPAITSEVFSPSMDQITTCIYFAPSDFQMQDYKGNMTTWQGFGKFIYDLNEGRDALPGSMKQMVHQLTDGITDPAEKVKKLYEYMQNNTRYISVQLGIGGLQTFDASYVAEKKYGDCKALSNYMHSLLKEAGIKSNLVVIRAGDAARNILPDFPSNQFDHMILCVPLKDTIWLECTSQTLPAGYLSGFTADRYAVLIDADGGKLVHTPRYAMKDNLEIRRIAATVNEEGSLHINANTEYTGLQEDYYHSLVHNLAKDKIKDRLHKTLDFATYDINQFNYDENKKALPVMNESLDITVSNYATITGKRLFLMPNIMTRSGRKLAQDSVRKFDIHLAYEYLDVDTVEITLPGGYQAEAIPQDVSLVSQFGKYSCSVRLQGNKLLYYRNRESYAGNFPARDFADLVKFYDAMYKADRNRVVLVKNE